MINHKSNGNFKSHITLGGTQHTRWTQEGLVALLWHDATRGGNW